MKRVYRKVSEWEEIAHNMWGTVKDKDSMLVKAISFTGNHRLYGKFMIRVVRHWPVSCENALTDTSINRKAWVGHAACAYAFKCPENIVRQAWRELTDEQRILANREAERAIATWERAYSQDRLLCTEVGEQVLL